MPAVKTDVTVFAAKLLNAGVGTQTPSGWVDIRTQYGGIFQVTVTNGGTKLDKAVQVQAEISPNQQAGNEFPFDCRHVAQQDPNDVTKFTIRIPPEVKFARLMVTEGDQNATIDAIFTRLDQV
jgi:hypothetical protein